MKNIAKVGIRCLARMAEETQVFMFRALLAIVAATSIMVSTTMASSVNGYYGKQTRVCYPGGPSSSECGYVEEGLSIKRRSDTTFYVYVITRGDNGHFCKYTGIARYSEGKYVAHGEGSDCRVTITISGNVANLESTRGCSVCCGARATLQSSGMRKR